MRKERNLAFFLSFFVFLLSWSYYAYFSEALNDGVWENANGFTGIIIPDTFLYRDIIDLSNPVGSVVFSGVKNTIGPSLIWFVTNGQWVIVSFVNSVCLFVGLMYFAKTARLFSVPSRKIYSLMALIALLPATVFHSVGALKEIPTLAFFSGFFYHYLKGDRNKWLLFAFLLVLFRYQIGLALLLFLVADLFNKQSFNVAFLVLIILSAAFPYIQQLEVFSSSATALYRELYGVESSLGGAVELIRNSIPGLSLFAVLIRVIQSIFEPFFTFFRKLTFYENGDLSIIDIVYFSSSVILFCYWLIFLKRIVLLLVNPSGVSKNVMRLYVFCLVNVVPIAGFSFIHHRYLYPLTSIILLAGVIRLKSYGLAGEVFGRHLSKQEFPRHE